MRPRRERAGKGKRRGLGGGIERDLGALPAIVDRGHLDRDIDRVQHHARDGLAHLDVDGLAARDRQFLQVRRELDRVT